MKKINVKLENIDKILENKESLLHNPISFDRIKDAICKVIFAMLIYHIFLYVFQFRKLFSDTRTHDTSTT